MITKLQLLAVIFPYISTFAIDDQFIRDLANSRELEQCDFGFVSDYKEFTIAHQIFADLDERL